jgi:hypothetical protein
MGLQGQEEDYGDALKSPLQVLMDVRNSFVSIEKAREEQRGR